MMKRWMAMGMALCLTAASLAGCSGTKDAAESTQAEAETSAEEAAGGASAVFFPHASAQSCGPSKLNLPF